MMLRISNRLYDIARGWIVLAILGLYTIYIALTFPALQTSPGGNIVSLDAGFFYTPAQAFAKIASYGDAREFWIRIYLTWDVVNPVLYSSALGLLISWLLKRAVAAGSRARLLNLLPFAGGLADLLENASIVAMMAAYPAKPAPVAWLATAFTMLKMTVLAGSALLVLAGLIGAAWNGFKTR